MPDRRIIGEPPVRKLAIHSEGAIVEFMTWNPDWFPLPGQAVFDRGNQQIAAVSRAPGNLDLFVIGFDNRVWTTFWNQQTGWNRDWFPLPGQAVFDHVNQQIAAVSRTPGNLDLFVIGFDNHIWSTFWGSRAPMTLEARVDQTSATVPLQIGVHIGATDGIVMETSWHASKNGALLPGIGDTLPAGVALDRILAVNEPGTYGVTVSRTGLVGPGGPQTLTRQFTIDARRPPDHEPPVPVLVPPKIEVDFNGSIAQARFHVTGGGFRPNLPDGPHGVSIRVVDANDPRDRPREFTRSSAAGTIDRVIEGTLADFKVDALGVATVAISATDGRPDKDDSTGFLWSNTVRTKVRP